MKVRRVVTGHTPDGKSMVASDTSVEPTKEVNEWDYFYLWSGKDTPIFPDDGSPQPEIDYFPPVGGFRFLIWTLPAGESYEMHASDTIDFAYIISGEVWMGLDNAVDVQLRTGDTLIQNGTMHDWHNKSNQPCIMAFWMTGAHRS